MMGLAIGLGIGTTLAADVNAAPAGQVLAAPLVSPEVLPDHRVTFRLRAPKATEVTISGDFWTRQGRVDPLIKGADGVWSLTTEPLPPDLYSYWFTVDGVPIPDPSNGQLKQGVRTQQSMFAVSGDDERLYENASVPHGEVRTVLYHSSVVGKERSMRVYLPPNYEGSKQRYPVMYLFHGGGDDDWGWVTVGRVNTIMDNLIAQGKAKPMIVVMPSLYALDPPVPTGRSGENNDNEALFRKSFFADVMPYVESHYRVLAGAAHRAVGGLGTGRDMLSNFIWPSLDQFGAIFFASGGTEEERFKQLSQLYPGIIDRPDNERRIRFYLGVGLNDAAIEGYHAMGAELKQRGYEVATFETPGTHGWPVFRRCFAWFAQRAVL
jgi:enterochelin esterase family protein